MQKRETYLFTLIIFDYFFLFKQAAKNMEINARMSHLILYVSFIAGMAYLLEEATFDWLSCKSNYIYYMFYVVSASYSC